MRELQNRDLQHRVKGIPALERRLVGLVRAVYRFGCHRATTRDEMLWTAKMFDGLTATLQAVRRPGDADEAGTHPEVKP